MSPTTFNSAIQALATEISELVISKQVDYGTGNILNTPLVPILGGLGFNQQTAIEIGILNRINDKIQRLINLYRKGNTFQNESVEDSWKDVAGYALLALLVKGGTFDLPLESPTVTPPKPPKASRRG